MRVANGGDGKVLCIDPASRKVIASIEVGEEMGFGNGLRLTAAGGAIG